MALVDVLASTFVKQGETPQSTYGAIALGQPLHTQPPHFEAAVAALGPINGSYSGTNPGNSQDCLTTPHDVHIGQSPLGQCRQMGQSLPIT